MLPASARHPCEGVAISQCLFGISGLSQNYEKLETIKAMGKKSGESGSAEEYK